MTLNVEKRFLALFLAFVMVFSLVPWWTIEVDAALNNTTAVIGLTITSNGNLATVSETTVTINCEPTVVSGSCGGADTYTPTNETVCFKNTSGSKATLSFENEACQEARPYQHP